MFSCLNILTCSSAISNLLSLSLTWMSISMIPCLSQCRSIELHRSRSNGWVHNWRLLSRSSLWICIYRCEMWTFFITSSSRYYLHRRISNTCSSCWILFVSMVTGRSNYSIDYSNTKPVNCISVKFSVSKRMFKYDTVYNNCISVSRSFDYLYRLKQCCLSLVRFCH